MHTKQGVCHKLLKKRKILKEKKKKKKKEKEKEDILISLSKKKGVQSRLPNEKRNREREHDTRSSWKMTLFDYNIWLMILI